MRDFHELKVWERAHRLVVSSYEVTPHFPSEERFGLTRQIRRAAVSIPSNIADGCGRNTEPEMARFLGIAIGSASELDYQILLARDLRYMDEDNYKKLAYQVQEVRRMLYAFMKKVAPDR
jgi:four helix bundle protein